jgi:MFS transporter, putative metabolite:H+ symporter
MSASVSSGPINDPYKIAARIERLPNSFWHTKARIVIGAAWFFDAFDALAIAYVLPVLGPLWKLTPQQIGLMIAIGFIGQAIGSITFGMLAERYGRVPNMIVSLLIFSLASLACAFAWNFQALLVFRFMQGVGLGGEIPVSAAYLNEISKAKGRGQFIQLTVLPFVFGLTAAAWIGKWVVPHWGWEWMFVLGVVPAVLSLFFRRYLSESPRWLASRGRSAEADRVLTKIEAEISDNGNRPLPAIPNLPPVPQATVHFGDFFKGIYLRRTITCCALYFCAYFVSNGLQGWLPTIYRTVYQLPLDQALRYGSIAQASALVGSIGVTFLVDLIGRKLWFWVALLGGSIPLLILGYQHAGGAHMDPYQVLMLMMLVYPCIHSVTVALAMYTAENYPTHMRALGGGIAAACLRAASFTAPYLIGFVLPAGGITAVFYMLGGVALIGSVICLLLAIETRGRIMEEIAPSPE